MAQTVSGVPGYANLTINNAAGTSLGGATTVNGNLTISSGTLSDSGNQITRAFCPDCGTMLFLRVSARPDLVAIRVGTLDDPSGFRPEADIFVKSAQPWDYMNPALPKYPTYPPGQAYSPSEP